MFKLDRFYAHNVLQDADYRPYQYRVYLNRTNGALQMLYDHDEDAYAERGAQSDRDNAVMRRHIEEHPENFIEIPVPEHGQYHEWFRSFLGEARRDEYFGSIGGWLQAYGDQDERYAWTEYSAMRVAEYVRDIARAAGLELEIE